MSASTLSASPETQSQSQQLVPFKTVAEWVPPARNGKKTYVSTIQRWAVNGQRRFDGKIIRLWAMRLGNRWVTTREAFDTFMRRLTPLLDEVESPGRKAKKPNIDRAERDRQDKEELAKLGI